MTFLRVCAEKGWGFMYVTTVAHCGSEVMHGMREISKTAHEFCIKLCQIHEYHCPLLSWSSYSKPEENKGQFQCRALSALP